MLKELNFVRNLSASSVEVVGLRLELEDGVILLLVGGIVDLLVVVSSVRLSGDVVEDLLVVSLVLLEILGELVDDSVQLSVQGIVVKSSLLLSLLLILNGSLEGVSKGFQSLDDLDGEVSVESGSQIDEGENGVRVFEVLELVSELLLLNELEVTSVEDSVSEGVDDLLNDVNDLSLLSDSGVVVVDIMSSVVLELDDLLVEGGDLTVESGDLLLEGGSGGDQIVQSRVSISDLVEGSVGLVSEGLDQVLELGLEDVELSLVLVSVALEGVSDLDEERNGIIGGSTSLELKGNGINQMVGEIAILHFIEFGNDGRLLIGQLSLASESGSIDHSGGANEGGESDGENALDHPDSRF